MFYLVIWACHWVSGSHSQCHLNGYPFRDYSMGSLWLCSLQCPCSIGYALVLTDKRWHISYPRLHSGKLNLCSCHLWKSDNSNLTISDGSLVVSVKRVCYWSISGLAVVIAVRYSSTSFRTNVKHSLLFGKLNQPNPSSDNIEAPSVPNHAVHKQRLVQHSIH